MTMGARPPSRIRFRDFDLLFKRAGGQFEVLVTKSPNGQARHVFSLDQDLHDLRQFHALGRTLRHSMQEWESLAHAFGDRLFQTVFSGEVGELYRRCEAGVRRGNGTRTYGLRIRLQFSDDAAELARLPWEYLRDSKWQQFLGLSPTRPVTRYLPIDLPRTRTEARRPLRILVVAPAPLDRARLDVRSEWESLQKSISELAASGDIELHRLSPPTMLELRRILLRESFDIFHFIGHGNFSETADTGILLFENDSGFSDAITAEHLGMVLQDQSIRLAVLNACDAATPSPHARFAGTAQQLLLKGLPAVVGMQFAISDRAAITFASELYFALVQGHLLEVAVVHGRGALYKEHDFEWGTPVLYMQSGPSAPLLPRAILGEKATEASGLSRAPRDENADEQWPARRKALKWLGLALIAMLASLEIWQLRPSLKSSRTETASGLMVRASTPLGVPIRNQGIVELERNGLPPLMRGFDSTGTAVFAEIPQSGSNTFTVRVKVPGYEQVNVHGAVRERVVTVSLVPVQAAPPYGPQVRVRIGKIGSDAPELTINGQPWGRLDSLTFVRVAPGTVKLRLILGRCTWDTTLVVTPGETVTIGRRKPRCLS